MNLRGDENPGGEQFICWAVGMVNGINERDSIKVKKMISEKLGHDWYASGGNNTLELWLAANHNIPQVNPIMRGMYITNDAAVKAYRAKIQRTRHAWVDSLIEEFEAKGD